MFQRWAVVCRYPMVPWSHGPIVPWSYGPTVPTHEGATAVRGRCAPRSGRYRIIVAGPPVKQDSVTFFTGGPQSALGAQGALRVERKLDSFAVRVAATHLSFLCFLGIRAQHKNGMPRSESPSLVPHGEWQERQPLSSLRRSGPYHPPWAESCRKLLLKRHPGSTLPVEP